MRHNRWLRGLAAVLAGVLTGLAWQPYGLWPLLLIGIPAFTLLVRDGESPPRRSAFGVGFVYGLGLLGVSISWIHVLGSWIAVLLIAFEALFFGLLGLTLHLTSALRWWPLAAALCWSLIEFLYARVPFGGFGWVRLAFAAVDTPLAGFLPLIGVAGVSFWWRSSLKASAYAVVLCSPIGTIRPPAVGWSRRRRHRRAGPAGRRPAVRPVEQLGDRRLPCEVGIVQGNVPGRGIEALGRMRSVTNNHLGETINLTVKARLGLAPMPDFILWPENSTDIDPTPRPGHRSYRPGRGRGRRPPDPGRRGDGGPGSRRAADRRPVVGSGGRRPGPLRQAEPGAVRGVDPVPRPAAAADPDPGGGRCPVGGRHQPGVLTVPVGGRTIEGRRHHLLRAGLRLDDLLHLTNGAQVLVVQSNNATYGGTGQIEQQFAITRARAMESRREIAVATTNSVSGYIDRDGRVVGRTTEFTAASLVVGMPLRSGLTPAVMLAPWLDRALAVGGLVAVLGLGALAGPGVADGRGQTTGTAGPSRRPGRPASRGPEPEAGGR